MREGYDGRVLHLARVSPVYGPTKLLISDPVEIERLAQWPVAIALQDVWEFRGRPLLIDDLGMPDRTILAGAQDGIIRPADKIQQLWDHLKTWTLTSTTLPLPANFYDEGKPRLIGSHLPGLPPTKAGKEEGKKIWRSQQESERARGLGLEAKRLNALRFGKCTCQACNFAHDDQAMFDAHHPTPLAAGVRQTFPEHFKTLPNLSPEGTPN